MNLILVIVLLMLLAWTVLPQTNRDANAVQIGEDFKSS